MAKRTTIEMKPGGLSRAGSGLKIPFNKTLEAKNVLLRPGRISKRPGALGEAIPAQPAMFQYAFNYLLATGAQSGTGPYPSSYRTGGAWVNASALWGSLDCCQLGIGFYGLTMGTDMGYSPIFGMTDPTTAISDSAGGETVSGSSICAEVGRLMVGAPIYVVKNELYAYTGYAFDDAAAWTLSGCTITVASSVRKLAVTVVAPTTKATLTAAAVTLTNNRYIRVAQSLQAVDLTREVPVTISLRDAAGVVYTRRQILLPTAKNDSTWNNYALEPVLVPSGVSLYVDVIPGIDAIPAIVGDAFNVSLFSVGADQQRGTLLKYGAYMPQQIKLASGPSFPFGGIRTERFDNRIAFCDVDDTKKWLGEFYVDCGFKVNLVRSVGGFVYGYGDHQIAIYQLVDNPDEPLAPTRLTVEGFGCYGPKSWQMAHNRQYFASANGVFEWDGQGPIKQLVPPDLLEEFLAGSSSVDASHALTVNEVRGELYYAASATLVYVLNLETGEWTRLQFTNDVGAAATIIDLFWARAEDLEMGEVWMITYNSVFQRVVSRIKTGQRTDLLDFSASFNGRDGTPRPITAEYWLHPVETPAPARMLTMDFLELDEEVTASQAASTFTVGVSSDGGTTFSPVATGTLGQANGDSVATKIPIHTTLRRGIVRMVHAGDGGDDAFNFNSAILHCQVRGEAKQAPNFS